MPIQISIDKPQRLVTSRCSGTLRDGDLAAVQECFDHDPNFNPRFSRIVDMTNVTAWEISDEMLNRWAASENIDARARRAIICTKPIIISGVLDFIVRARRYSRDVSVFPNYDEARNWIEHPDDVGEN